MEKINKHIIEAYKVLGGEEISRELAGELINLGGEDILDLVSLAQKVKMKYAPQTKVCSIVNAKSGRCSQDCAFCSQSMKHTSEIEEYDLMSKAELIENAKKVYESGVRTYGIVTSGYGYTDANDVEFKNIIEAIDALHNEFPDMRVCASTGILSEETACELAKHNVYHYNLNLQTNPEKYGTLISTTHSVEERMATIKLLNKYGIGVCSGGIIGMGETALDRVELAFACRKVDSDVIPVNVLIPVKGTAVENNEPLSVAEIVKTFAVFRLVNPSKIIKCAAGRETRLKDFQGLVMLCGVNGFITGGYLTTRGRAMEEDSAFLNELCNFNKQNI